MGLCFITSKMFSVQGKRNLFRIIIRSNHNWIKPVGHDTGIKVYNCITKNKEPFIVRNKFGVTWYTCGPTVYDSAHIGHASTYVKLDIIQRILRNYFNLNVITVMNITDVDDKLIARSNALKVSVSELAKKYEKEFLSDLDSLQVLRPDCVVRVTDHIETIKNFIKVLMDSGKAYQGADGSIYFDLAKYENVYGKLEKISEEFETDLENKKSSKDFALWKAAKSPGEIKWDSLWGAGRPGWHIECSALASHIFGSSIDVHAGGIDLRFPHHENEECQSCAYHRNAQWVSYWIHTGHLHLNMSAEKMSKSLKNTIAIKDMLETTDANVFRLACLMNHYRSNMEFTPDFMKTAENYLNSYKNFADSCNNVISGNLKCNLDCDLILKLIENSVENIHSALVDDFNTPKVIKVLNELVSTINNMIGNTKNAETIASGLSLSSLLASVKLVDSTLSMCGISLSAKVGTVEMSNFNEVMDILIEFRKEIRQIGIETKDKRLLSLCDGVRDDLKRLEISVKDHGKTSSWVL